MSVVLTANDVMMCPHGGTVTIVPGQVRAEAEGGMILRPSDTFAVAGCPFNVAGGYHPCVTVSWQSSSLRASAGGDAVLTVSSVGLCLAADQAPQGSVLIQKTQKRAEAQ